MLSALTTAVVIFCVLAFVFVPLERLFAARPQAILRPGVLVDGLFFLGQYLLWSSASVALLGFVQDSVRGQGNPLFAWSATLPLWLQAVLAVVFGDLFVYWFHRACHRFEFLWRFHAVHHSSTHLDWLAAHREHPVDGLLTQLCQNLPAFLLGLQIEALAALIVLRSAWGIFIHSNTRIAIGPLRFILGAPELHHFHHARVRETKHNFANLAPYLDVVFGTYYKPGAEHRYALGLTETWPKAYWAQLILPPQILAGPETPAVLRTFGTLTGHECRRWAQSSDKFGFCTPVTRSARVARCHERRTGGARAYFGAERKCRRSVAGRPLSTRRVGNILQKNNLGQ